MLVMQLEQPGSSLHATERDLPSPCSGEVLIQIQACGVCRTDLHIIDGDLPMIKKPLIPGHEIVGNIVQMGEKVTGFSLGDRVGVPWLGYTCKQCRYCLSGHENLCDHAKFTGYSIDGGYAEYVVANHEYCLAIPREYSSQEAAPLLCAGLIGYRALTMTGNANCIGLFGFGAAAHIICQVMVWQGREVFAFTRPSDLEAQKLAYNLGAAWAGGSNAKAPKELDAAIIFAPVGDLVILALRQLAKGGKIVCAGIHMSDIPSFPYHLLWGEREICSVTNLTRSDGLDFMAIAPKVPIRTISTIYPLSKANEALKDLREGRVNGAAVIA